MVLLCYKLLVAGIFSVNNVGIHADIVAIHIAMQNSIGWTEIKEKQNASMGCSRLNQVQQSLLMKERDGIHKDLLFLLEQ